MTCRVLLVEDEILIAMLVENLLDKSGCEPVLAATNADAMAIIEHAPAFDLAVVDFSLPDGDGSSVIGALWDRWPVPVIVSTGHQGMQETLRAALPSFAAPIEVILKPWTEEQLLGLVRRFLPHAQS
jgi:two-component system sensor histidine kinase TorS